MARDFAKYTSRGARIAAISVDSPARNAGMTRKLALPFPLLSDPDGSRAIHPFGVWIEAGKMAKPAIIVLDANGHERYRYVGEDFADRPGDDEVLAALAGLDLPALDIASEPVPHVEPNPSPRAMGLADLGVYMRGVRFAMTALSGRMQDASDRAEAERMGSLAEGFIAAQGATLRLKEQQQRQ